VPWRNPAGRAFDFLRGTFAYNMALVDDVCRLISVVGLQFVGPKPFGFREHIAELKDHFVVAIHDGGAAP
jgi:hypothetical protein